MLQARRREGTRRRPGVGYRVAKRGSVAVCARLDVARFAAVLQPAASVAPLITSNPPARSANLRTIEGLRDRDEVALKNAKRTDSMPRPLNQPLCSEDGLVIYGAFLAGTGQSHPYFPDSINRNCVVGEIGRIRMPVETGVILA